MEAGSPAPKGSSLSLGHIPKDLSAAVCGCLGHAGWSQPPLRRWPSSRLIHLPQLSGQRTAGDSRLAHSSQEAFSYACHPLRVGTQTSSLARFLLGGPLSQPLQPGKASVQTQPLKVPHLWALGPLGGCVTYRHRCHSPLGSSAGGPDGPDGLREHIPGPAPPSPCVAARPPKLQAGHLRYV